MKLVISSQQQADIGRLCREYGVLKLLIFGSAVRGDLATESDLDFVATFVRPAPMGAASQYFGFKDALEEMFSRPVDLIVESAIDNQYLKKSIESSAWTLYAA